MDIFTDSDLKGRPDFWHWIDEEGLPPVDSAYYVYAPELKEFQRNDYVSVLYFYRDEGWLVKESYKPKIVAYKNIANCKPPSRVAA